MLLQFWLALCVLISVNAHAQAPKPSPAKRVLFICTGNFYRSRFAEALFNKRAGDAHLDWRAVSRGFKLYPSQRGISPIAKDELLKFGVRKFSQLDPQRLTKADLQKCDYVVLMDEAEHRPMLEKLFPNHDERKIHYWHIPDAGAMAPDEAGQAMARQIQELIGKLAG